MLLRRRSLMSGLRKLYVYDNGDQCTSITGGYSNYAEGSVYTSSISLQSNYMLIYCYYGGHVMCPVNKIDLTNYKKLGIVFDTQSVSSDNNGYFDIYKGDIRGFRGIGDCAMYDADAQLIKKENATYAKQTIEVDIRSVTGSYYLSVGTWASMKAATYYRLYEMYLLW